METQTVMNTAVVGARGQMAQKFMPFLYQPSSIDIKTLRSKRNVKQAVSSVLSRTQRSHNIDQMLILALPLQTFQSTDQITAINNPLRELLGHSGRGQSSTLCLYVSSIHNCPSQVLEIFSGMVIGIHQLYAPKVTDLSSQTVVLTVSPKKQKHHLYRKGLRMAKQLMLEMGHGQVRIMEPKHHDRFMAMQQLLTHSYFLLVAAALRQLDNPQDMIDRQPVLDRHIAIVNRILDGNGHVYSGIAHGNPENQYFIDAFAGLADNLSEPLSFSEFYRYFSDWTQQQINQACTDLQAGPQEIKYISTPVSRVRDELLKLASKPCSLSDGIPSIRPSALIRAYLHAIRTGYENWFEKLKTCRMITKNTDTEVIDWASEK